MAVQYRSKMPTTTPPQSSRTSFSLQSCKMDAEKENKIALKLLEVVRDIGKHISILGIITGGFFLGGGKGAEAQGRASPTS